MLKILTSEMDIAKSRDAMRCGGLNCLPNRFSLLLRSLGLVRSITVGDLVKSWDVELTLNFIRKRLSTDASVLDIGAYASEILPALERVDYCNLVGVDLDPNVKRMPTRGVAEYKVGNFYDLEFSHRRFDAITAISVIEHGYDPEALLRMLSARLANGGYFIASFDYWSEKVDTNDVSAFQMDWTIFSSAEVLSLVHRAEDFGLYPVGNLEFTKGDRIIEWNGRNYTFAWLVLQRKSEGSEGD